MLILFQGDSITDAGRYRDAQLPNTQLGNGYVKMVADTLHAEDSTIDVFNRGINGDRLPCLESRWATDTLSIKYDILSILCGINDFGESVSLGTFYSEDTYESIYDDLLCQAKNANPRGRFILIEPFVFCRNLPGEDYGRWYDGIKKQGEIVYKLAQKHKAAFVPAFSILRALVEKIGIENVTADGVHLVEAGNRALANAWIQEYHHMQF